MERYLIQIKRIYDKPQDTDGFRVLVDRIWPRGISKDKAHVDEWNKEIAPSTELRKWFGHEIERFEGFRLKYLIELKSKEFEIKRILDIAKSQPVTLLYGAKDPHFNQARVLLDLINTTSSEF